MKMKAAVFERPGLPLEVREVEVPQVGPGQLLIRIERCGVCGSDLHLSDTHSRWNPAPGTVMGHEFSGEIVELGEGVKNHWREGDRVTALPYIGCGHCAHCLSGHSFHCPMALALPTGDLVGGYGQYAVVGSREAIKLADSVSWEEAAFTEPLAVGLHAVAVSSMRPGTPVLVLGAGPVGLAIAACARIMAAGPVIVSARSDRSADLAIKMGATAFLLNDDELPQKFAAIAGGPPEIVFEAVGLPGMMERSADLVVPRGEVMMAGACNGDETIFAITPTVKETTFRFVACYSIREFASAYAMIENGRIDPGPMFGGLVGLNEFPVVFESLRTDKPMGKLMLNPWM